MTRIEDAVRVLVADDDPTVRVILSSQLTEWGFDVVTVDDGEAALAALRAPDAPSIALLDWMMPGLSGPEVCRRISAGPGAAGRYMIIVTSKHGGAEVAEGLDAGADDFISKPCDARELRARLGVAVRVARLENQLLERVDELQEALDKVEQLRSLIPICMYCHNVSEDKDYWQRLDHYVARHGMTFSHSICPTCFENKVEPELQAAGA